MNAWVRPASLGFLDGTTTNLAVLGFALNAAPGSALLLGVASWLAGALSMGVNEYASVADQNRAEGTTYCPVTAAVSSFVSFTLGAVLPLAPLVFGSPVAWCLLVGAVLLAVAGVVLGRFTGRAPLPAAVRQLAIGGVALAVTFAVGAALGVSTA